MAQYNIAVVVGSLRRESLNKKLADAVTRLGPSDFAFGRAEIADLPLYNQDDDANPAASVTRFKGEISSASGVLFVTPEYNRSVPGVLKNAIDQASRPYGKSVWGGKPAGIIGISPGAAGTAMAQQHLRNILSSVDVPVLPLPEAFTQAKDGLFDEAGNIGAASKAFFQKWMDKYVAWIKLHAK